MKTIVVRYKTAAEHADANAASVRAVYEELRVLAPSGFRYATYRLPDATFVHIATLETSVDAPLTSLASFKAFQSHLKERCVEMPVVAEATLVGSYGAFP